MINQSADPQLPDESLVCLVVDRDQAAFSALVRRHSSRFLHFSARFLQSNELAEDAVQNAFIKLWQKPQRFSSEKGKFTTWMYRVVLNESRDLLRRQRVSDAMVQRYIQECVGHQVHASQSSSAIYSRATELIERQVAIEFALRHLKAVEQMAINLVICENLPQQEVAHIMQISIKALESILYRAKNKMTQLLSNREPSLQPSLELQKVPKNTL